MKVILTQDVANVGQKFEIKEVADGFAINFLIPQGKAKHASQGAIKDLEAQKTKALTEKAKKDEVLLTKLNDVAKTNIVIERKATEEGHLFAKVDEKVISKALNENGLEIDESQIILKEPIKEAGVKKVNVAIGESEVEISIEIKSKG